jgi:hypothetical protein
MEGGSGGIAPALRPDAGAARAPIVRRQTPGSRPRQASAEGGLRRPLLVPTRRELPAGDHACLPKEQRDLAPRRVRAAARIRPTQQRAGAPSGAPGLLLCHEAGVSPCAPGRRPTREHGSRSGRCSPLVRGRACHGEYTTAPVDDRCTPMEGCVDLRSAATGSPRGVPLLDGDSLRVGPREDRRWRSGLSARAVR